MIEICKDRGVETIYAIMLGDNYRAINLMKKMGFNIKYLDDGTVKATLNLKKKKQKCKAQKKECQKQQTQTQLEQKESEAIQE